MVPNGTQDLGVLQPATTPSTKSKKNKKRKNKNGNSKANGDAPSQNGNGHAHGSVNGNADQDIAASEDELDSPQVEENPEYSQGHEEASTPVTNGSHSEGGAKDAANGVANGTSPLSITGPSSPTEDQHVHSVNAEALSDTERRFEVAAKERDQLRDEVIELRKSLESIQQRHDTSQQRHEEELATLNAKAEMTAQKYKDEVAGVNAQLDETQQRYEVEITRGNERQEELQRRHEEEMSVAKQRVEDNQKGNMEEINNVNTRSQEMRKQYEEQVADLKSQLERSQKEHVEELSSVTTQLDEVQNTHEKALSATSTRFEDTKRNYEEELGALNGKLEEVQQHHSEELGAVTTKLEEKQRQHDEELNTMNAKLEQSQKQREEEVSGVDSRLGEKQKQYDEEVASFNARLEELQQRHEDELASVNGRLEETQTGKDHAESQYQKLLGKVNTIKTQLGERLKADAADLLQARAQIEEIEEQNRAVTENNQALQTQIAELTSEKEQLTEDITNLRARANLSQQNWVKERDDLLMQEAQVREEFESAKQAMQDWEVLAMEERSVREGLGDRVAELEEQLSNQRDAYERAASDRDTQSVTVDGLQRALHDIQEARKIELRELVENTQTQLEELRKQLKVAEESAAVSQSALETTRQELEKALPFEREVKEKNLLIGKLRHEAVILNDHLTKALRFLKRAKPEDTVDRQLVTNHFLQFLALDRSDPKKFQILQLISAILSWNEEQNESAGLARPGASAQPMNPNSSLRAPLSPFLRRVSSNAALSPQINLNSIFNNPSASTALPSTAESGSESPAGSKESLAELWSGFLERENLARGEGAAGRRDTAVVSPTSGTSTPRYGGYGLGQGSRRPSMTGGGGT